MNSSDDYRVRLFESSGERHWWTVQFRSIAPVQGRTQYGRCSFATRTITINARLRSREAIDSTILHETLHVAAGEVASEWLAEAVEANFEDAIHKLYRKKK